MCTNVLGDILLVVTKQGHLLVYTVVSSSVVHQLIVLLLFSGDILLVGTQQGHLLVYTVVSSSVDYQLIV